MASPINWCRCGQLYIGLPEVSLTLFLNPGDWWFGANQPGVLTTILGSCVSIVLLHPGASMLGVSHALLPRRSQQPGPMHGRFADEVVLIFCRQLQLYGLKAADCQVQLYGGGEMFQRASSARGSAIPQMVKVGEHNIQVSLQALTAAGFTVLAQDTGGHCYRRLQVNLQNGVVNHDKYPLQPGSLPAF